MCENGLSGYQKLEAEKLFRDCGPGFAFPSWKGVAFPRLILAQELGESWIPINISYEGHRVFRFFLNSKGCDTERLQASPVQKCPPCIVSLWVLLGPREIVLFLLCGYLSPSVVLCPWLNTSETWLTFQVGMWVQFLPSNFSLSYYTSNNKKVTHQSITWRKPLFTYYFIPFFF